MPRRRLTARSILPALAVALSTALGAPAYAEWSADPDQGLALVKGGESLLAYTCNDEVRGLIILTPHRVPARNNGFFGTTYQIDGGERRAANLFERGGDPSKPEYKYELVLDVRGEETRLDDGLSALANGRHLSIRMMGTRTLSFPLAGARQAIDAVSSACGSASPATRQTASDTDAGSGSYIGQLTGQTFGDWVVTQLDDIFFAETVDSSGRFPFALLCGGDQFLTVYRERLPDDHEGFAVGSIRVGGREIAVGMTNVDDTPLAMGVAVERLIRPLRRANSFVLVHNTTSGSRRVDFSLRGSSRAISALQGRCR